MDSMLLSFTRLSALACLIWFISLVWGQDSPCPDVFSYEEDLISGSSLSQTYGHIELRNLLNMTTVKLIVVLFFNVDVATRNMVSIRLVKSNRQTLRDIHNNLPAQYRVNFPPAESLPAVLKIIVNGEIICIGQPPAGSVSVVPVVLEHTMYTSMQTVSNSNNQIQVQQPPQPVYTLPNTLPPPVQQTTTVKDLPTDIFNGSGIQIDPPEPAYTGPFFFRPPAPHNLFIEDILKVISDDSNNNRAQFQQPLSYTLPNYFGPPAQQITTLKDLLTASNVDCGTVVSGRTRRAINAMDSDRGQFPWAAPVFKVHQISKTQLLCGSTIITILHVVTAAKCVYFNNGIITDADKLVVVPGMFDINSFFERTNQVRYVAQIHVSPTMKWPSDFANYESPDSNSAIAVLKLNEPIKFNNLIRPICVWDGTDDLSEIVGQQGLVSGWGSLEKAGNTRFPGYLNATVIDIRQCRQRLLFPIPSNSRLFCADGNRGVLCFGDIGSGLVFQRGTRFYLRGIAVITAVDFETLLCDTERPTVYTDLAPLRFWMSRVLKM